MSNVIEIKFSHDLPTKKQNELRYRLELAKWKEDWRIAESIEDYKKMDELNASYDMVGLP